MGSVFRPLLCVSLRSLRLILRRLGFEVAPLYNEHMKRTTLVLNEQILEEAQKLSGERTYSRTVQIALEDFVRRAKARRILSLKGVGSWKGDLSEMREDHGSR